MEATEKDLTLQLFALQDLPYREFQCKLSSACVHQHCGS